MLKPATMRKALPFVVGGASSESGFTEGQPESEGELIHRDACDEDCRSDGRCLGRHHRRTASLGRRMVVGLVIKGSFDGGDTGATWRSRTPLFGSRESVRFRLERPMGRLLPLVQM